MTLTIVTSHHILFRGIDHVDGRHSPGSHLVGRSEALAELPLEPSKLVGTQAPYARALCNQRPRINARCDDAFSESGSKRAMTKRVQVWTPVGIRDRGDEANINLENAANLGSKYSKRKVDIWGSSRRVLLPLRNRIASEFR